MIRIVCVFVILCTAFARQPGGHPHDTYDNYCYQCEYGPPKAKHTIVEDIEEYEVKIPHTKVHCWYVYEYEGDYDAHHPNSACTYHNPDCEHETTYEIQYKTRKVPRTVTTYTESTGYAACEGPITHESANRDGVDIWECHGNCYVRVGKHNVINRGCYNHEVGVNQNHLGCHEQSGSRYCFCKGKECNGKHYTKYLP